jgi:hypothetical protein
MVSILGTAIYQSITKLKEFRGILNGQFRQGVINGQFVGITDMNTIGI